MESDSKLNVHLKTIEDKGKTKSESTCFHQSVTRLVVGPDVPEHKSEPLKLDSKLTIYPTTMEKLDIPKPKSEPFEPESELLKLTSKPFESDSKIGMDDKNQTTQGMYCKKLSQKIDKMSQNSDTSITDQTREPMRHFNNVKAMIFTEIVTISQLEKINLLPFLNIFSKYDMNRVNPYLETTKAYLEFAEPSATMASTTASVASKTREAQQVCIHASYCKLNYVIGMDDKNQTVQGMYRKKLPQKSEHFGDIKTRETASKKTASKKRRLLLHSTMSFEALQN